MYDPVSLKFLSYSQLTVSENTEKINKISYESKMTKIYELSLIFMHLNRNLNTAFYAVIAVSYGKEYFIVVYENKPFLLLSAWRKERKNG